MNAAGSGSDVISVHNFSARISEQRIHFHVMKMSGAFLLWVGVAPALSNLAVAMRSRHDSSPPALLLLGDPAETAPHALAQRLAQKTRKQVFVSYNLPVSSAAALALQVEERIKTEMDSHPEHF